MLKEYQKQLSRIFRLLDLLIVVSTFFVVYNFQASYLDKYPSSSLPSEHHLLLFVNAVAWIYLSKWSRLYNSKRFSRFVAEVYDIVKTTACCIAVASVSVILISGSRFGLNFFPVLLVSQAVGLILFRLVLRGTLKYIRSRGYNYRQILVVGCNVRAANLARRIEEMPELGLRILGFIDAPNGNGCCKKSYDFKIIGDLDDLEGIVRTQVVDEVFITLPIKSYYSEIERILRLCETVGVEAKIPTNLFNLQLSKSTISKYLDLPVIDLYTSPRMTWQTMAKRVMDVTVSLTLLIALLPLLVIVSILIKTGSKGPVFFKQKRVGYNGRLFTLLKFRTMVENAEELKKELFAFNEMDVPVFKMRNDPRVTKIGRFLRKMSIDELPQLINVLKGDMSLVGPRPPVPSEVNQYDLCDRRRLSIRPGITGIWQVSGRNEIPFDKWMEMDRQYIDQWSLWLDFKLLVKTIPAVWRGSGAA